MLCRSINSAAGRRSAARKRRPLAASLTAAIRAAVLAALVPWIACAPHRAAAQQAPSTDTVTRGEQPTAPPGSGATGWSNWQYATGDWGGLRSWLTQQGVTVLGHYVSEVSGNPVGGREQGGAYAHEFMGETDFDLGKLIGLNEGFIHFNITERAGSSLSKDKIYNVLTVREIYGDGQTTRLTQLAYEQKLAGGRVDIEAGRLITENDFAASSTYWGQQLYCNFQSNAICGTPIAAPLNSGYVAYPASSWGAHQALPGAERLRGGGCV